MNLDKNKKVRVYVNGERQKDMYQHRTSVGVFFIKVKLFFKRLILISVFIGIIIGICAIVRYAYPVYEIKLEKEQVILDNLKVKIDELKGSLIKDIHDVERAGRSEEDALITFDPNTKNKKVEIPSIGTCQFKVSTVIYYEQKLHGVAMTRKEAVLLALDDQKCLSLMSEIIFTEEDGWCNWYNSGLKVNAKSRLAIIRELEK